MIWFLSDVGKVATPNGFLLFANAFLSANYFICVLAIYCQFAKSLFPPLFFPFSLLILNGLFLHLILNILNLVHVSPPPAITYLIIYQAWSFPDAPSSPSQKGYLPAVAVPLFLFFCIE
jgi:hypothetical protein